MEMEIQKDYKEVLIMLESVLLHIFRGIKGMYHLVLQPWYKFNIEAN